MSWSGRECDDPKVEPSPQGSQMHPPYPRPFGDQVLPTTKPVGVEVMLPLGKHSLPRHPLSFSVDSSPSTTLLWTDRWTPAWMGSEEPTVLPPPGWLNSRPSFLFFERDCIHPGIPGSSLQVEHLVGGQCTFLSCVMSRDQVLLFCFVLNSPSGPKA